MVDITLSSDRIRTAPVEVRRWIEHELADSLGMWASAPAHHEHLAICNQDELVRVFDFVQGMPPVGNVLLELGRSTGPRLPGNVAMTHLSDIADRTHLQGASQVVACLKIINEALQELRNDADVVLCAVDDEERCYVALETQSSIRRMWQAIVAARVHAIAATKAMPPTCAPPYSVEVTQSSQAAPQDQTQDQIKAI